MPLQATSGAASYDGFGGGVPFEPTYIEQIFATHLYTGNDTNSRVITNGIDLAGKGGLVITAPRSPGNFWSVADTARGASNWLYTQSTGAQQTGTDRYGSFNSNGYTMGSSAANGYMNYGGYTYASWTFRKQPKFFDVVTYTGNGTARTIAHSLGSVPGCIIVKMTDNTNDWVVYHQSQGNTKVGWLNLTSAFTTGGAAYWNNTTPTSTVFSLGNDISVNQNGRTYVAYLFAHNAGGFGLTGSDNVISCGDFTTNSSGVATVNLGYEPQWLLIKQTTGTRGWFMYDNMRGMFANGGAFELLANSTASEQDYTAYNNIAPTATGFVTGSGTFYSSTNYIYIAIRRGPMKTPTSGTSVFSPNSSSGSAGTQITTNFPADALLAKYRSGIDPPRLVDRLRGLANTDADTNPQLTTNTTDAEAASNDFANTVWNTGFKLGGTLAGLSTIYYAFRRAPGFFDEVCYTGTGSATTQTHNLGVVPEMMIVKRRTTAGGQWKVYAASLGNNKSVALDDVGAAATATNWWNATTPTSTVFSVGTSPDTNNSGSTLVAYLFASCPGVSKVGSYTGTGTTLQIDCGFTGGARFVLIKRTDSTGDWYVWDSARGIVAGNDPYLLLNSTAAEVTNTDYIDTYSAGFEISSTAPAAINANGGSFVFLAIA